VRLARRLGYTGAGRAFQQSSIYFGHGTLWIHSSDAINILVAHKVQILGFQLDCYLSSSVGKFVPNVTNSDSATRTSSPERGSCTVVVRDDASVGARQGSRESKPPLASKIPILRTRRRDSRDELGNRRIVTRRGDDDGTFEADGTTSQSCMR
jgi:hypothetical protein